MRSSSPAIGSSASIAMEKSRRSNAAKRARHCRNEGTGRIAAGARELIHLLRARCLLGSIANHGLRQRDMHVGKRHAGARQRTVGEIIHHAPCVRVTRMPGEFPAPQKRNRIVHLRARRSAMHVGRERLPEEPQRRRRLARLEPRQARDAGIQMTVQQSVTRIKLTSQDRQEIRGPRSDRHPHNKHVRIEACAAQGLVGFCAKDRSDHRAGVVALAVLRQRAMP